ncbi:hypothetical protein BGX27_011016 [Mortierella sp. AM989]|nr:hypothetical protein BGX27_011016 [Mortierella sp. AM989]
MEFAFARAGSKLYIQGGRFFQNKAHVTIWNQLFSLDLSTSWSVDSPPWEELKPGTINFASFGVATPDNKTFLVFMNGITTVRGYDIPTNTWNLNPVEIPDQKFSASTRPVLDPETGLIYWNANQTLHIYNPSTSVKHVQPMPPTIPSRRFGDVSYISSRRSLMYVGGVNETWLLDDGASQVREYSLTSGNWSYLTTTGQPPTPRAGNCVAASEDGNILIVYGGKGSETKYISTLYILDVPTGKWAQGPDGSVRAYMACIIVGDQLLAWGGTDGNNTLTVTPEVFSLTTRQWVKNYTAPSYYTNPSPTPSGSETTGTSSMTPLPSNPSSNNLSTILGCVIGGLLAILLSGGIYIYLKRKGRKGEFSDAGKSETTGDQWFLQPLKSLTTFQNAPQSYKTSSRDPQALYVQECRPLTLNPELIYTAHRKDTGFNQTDSPVMYSSTSLYPPIPDSVAGGIYAHDPYTAGQYGNVYDTPYGVAQDAIRNVYSGVTKTQYGSSVQANTSHPLTVSQNYHAVPGATLAPAIIDTATGQVYIVSAPPGNIMSVAPSTNTMAISTPSVISTGSNASSPNIKNPVSATNSSSASPQSLQSLPAIPPRPRQNVNMHYPSVMPGDSSNQKSMWTYITHNDVAACNNPVPFDSSIAPSTMEPIYNPFNVYYTFHDFALTLSLQKPFTIPVVDIVKELQTID